MNLLEYARNELNLIPKDEEGMQEHINESILEIIEVFADQGYSSLSANYSIQCLERLMRYKPLTPLTGEAEEWNLVSEDKDCNQTYQNRRCSSLFKEVGADTSEYKHDNDAVIVSDDGGLSWFSAKEFIKEVTFPYTPPLYPEKVYIEYHENGKDYDVITDKPDRIAFLRARAEKVTFRRKAK